MLGSQAAKTYLERNFEAFTGCNLDQLVQHALKALAASVQDGELKREAVTVSVVGRDMPFTILDDAILDSALSSLKVLTGILHCTLAPSWQDTALSIGHVSTVA